MSPAVSSLWPSRSALVEASKLNLAVEDADHIPARTELWLVGGGHVMMEAGVQPDRLRVEPMPSSSGPRCVMASFIRRSVERSSRVRLRRVGGTKNPVWPHAGGYS